MLSTHSLFYYYGSDQDDKWHQNREMVTEEEKEQGKWVSEQKGMQEWGRILRWNKLSMWEGTLEGWKSPLEENRLRERAMRWRGKRPWNNARLGNKRERGLNRNKRWAVRMGFCLYRSRRHCGLVLRRMIAFRCLKIFLTRLSEWMLKSLVLSLISNKVTNHWYKWHKWLTIFLNTVSVYKCASLMGHDCLFPDEIKWHNFLKRTAHPNMILSSITHPHLKCTWFSFFNATHMRYFAHCLLPFSIQKKVAGSSEKVLKITKTIKVA